MKLFEYEAKELARKAGIPVPRGGIASTRQEAEQVARTLGGPVVVKAQVLVAGRGKAGGIRPANDPVSASNIAGSLLGGEIKGEKTQTVLVEEFLQKKAEKYLSIVLNRTGRCFSVLASAEGGVDIEEVSERSPEKIIRYDIDPLIGLFPFKAREIASQAGLPARSMESFAQLILRLYGMAMGLDAEIVESNPVVETEAGELVAADLRVIVDDNSVFRHPDLESAKRPSTEMTPLEVKARSKGLFYVELSGNIGVIGNGAGLVMATLDMIKQFGGNPANFCDVGGGASADRVSSAIEVIDADPAAEKILVNIMAGITRCDEVAAGIVEGRRKTRSSKPVVVRMVGTGEEEGRQILSKIGIQPFRTMEEATNAVIKI